MLSVANVYNYQNFEISFLEAYDGNLDLSDIIGYIKNTFYNVSDINLVMNVVKANDSEGAHTSFYINSETMQDLMDDASKPMSNKSSVIGFTKYGEYFIASDSTSMSGIEINYDHTTKAVTVRYSYMNNVYRMNGDEIDEGGATSGYFYVEDASNTRSTNVLTIKKSDASAPSITVYKSTDQTNWTLMGTTDTTGITAEIPANGKLYLKATSSGWCTNRSYDLKYNIISCNNYFNVGGKIMSLLAGDDFANINSLSNYNISTFTGLFSESVYLRNANKLKLPTDTQTNCYYQMFSGCTSLTATPALPATTLATYCYRWMFQDCTSLTTAPALPATTLAQYCYYGMFYGCTSLTNAPALPATTLTNGCYSYMFQGCTSLTSAPVLPATTLANGCYSTMFYGCTSLTTAPALPATTLADGCYQNMFYGCTSLTTAPLLPATTLAQACYNCMFRDCTALTTAPLLPATTLATSCYMTMFKGCTSLTTAPVLSSTTLDDNCYQYMFQDCTNLNEVTAYANDISASDCLTDWLDGVASTGNFYNMGTATYTVDSASGIPQGWTEYKESENYFWIENTTNQPETVTIKKNHVEAPDVTVYYSTNQTNWNLMGTTNTSGITQTINANSKLYLKATATAWGSRGSNTYPCNNINCNGNFNIGGNIMSLLAGDNFTNANSLNNDSFSLLFQSNQFLINAKHLIMPATILGDYCYCMMFNNCRHLINTPVLPATTLAQYCYFWMFLHCESLTTAPTLPATTLASYCYNGMFERCTSLTTAPALPVTTLVNSCYMVMFRGCTSLTTAPALPATTLTQYCYNGMFQDCTSLTTAPVLPATTLAGSCYANMFSGCTALTTAPELPATTLVPYCYMAMFKGCTSLTTTPALSSKKMSIYCYMSMFQDCTSLNEVTTYANDISSSNCLDNWLNNVASSGDFYNLGTATYESGDSGIPSGWTEHTSL